MNVYISFVQTVSWDVQRHFLKKKTLKNAQVVRVHRAACALDTVTWKKQQRIFTLFFNVFIWLLRLIDSLLKTTYYLLFADSDMFYIVIYFDGKIVGFLLLILFLKSLLNSWRYLGRKWGRISLEGRYQKGTFAGSRWSIQSYFLTFSRPEKKKTALDSQQSRIYFLPLYYMVGLNRQQGWDM